MSVINGGDKKNPVIRHEKTWRNIKKSDSPNLHCSMCILKCSPLEHLQMVWIQLGPVSWGRCGAINEHEIACGENRRCLGVFCRFCIRHFPLLCLLLVLTSRNEWMAKARVFQFPWSDSAVLSMALQQIWKINWNNIDRKTLQILVKFAWKVIKMEADPLDNRPCQKRFNTYRMSPQIVKHSLNFTWIQKVTRSQISIPSTGLHPKQMNEPYEGLAAMANYVHFQCQDIIAIGCNSINWSWWCFIGHFLGHFCVLVECCRLEGELPWLDLPQESAAQSCMCRGFVWLDETCGRESVNGESFADSLLPWRSQAESESLIIVDQWQKPCSN